MGDRPLKKIMIVDDEFIVRVGIRSIVNWEEHGYVMAAEAADGQEALEKIGLYRPDIVLTDLVMGNMDGFELIRICAERYPEISFVVLSSYNDFENVRRAMKLGVRDYIFKLTATPGEILRILDEISAGMAAGPRSPEPQGGILDGVIRENLQVIKNNLLRRCAGGEEILSQFKALSLKVDLTKPYVLLYISIDDFTKLRMSGELTDIPLIKSSMENIILEILGKDSDIEVFNYEKGDMVVFCNIPAVIHGFYDDTSFRDGFFKIREYIKRYLGFYVSGIISPVLTGIRDLFDVLGVCGETLRRRTGGAELLPYGGGQRNEITLAREYILARVSEHPGLGEIAAAVGKSESYFSHLFKKETGINVIDYINLMKMERAAEILENSDRKIADVACLVGIDNCNYFSILFKKFIGFSPREYRERSKIIKGEGKSDDSF
jgi:two-component system response regulator YesN